MQIFQEENIDIPISGTKTSLNYQVMVLTSIPYSKSIAYASKLLFYFNQVIEGTWTLLWNALNSDKKEEDILFRLKSYLTKQFSVHEHYF